MGKEVLVIVVFAAILIGLAGTVTGSPAKTLIPVADSYVSSVNLGSNYGGQSFFDVSNSGNMLQGINDAFLMFDLEDVPSGATIKTVQLRLYTGAYVASTHTISAYYCSDSSWAETTLTFENMPPFSNTPLDTVFVASSSTWYEWNVTSIVQSAFQGTDGNLTLVLTSDYHDGADWVSFESRDQQYSWMDRYRPQLVISYDAPETPTTPFDLIIGAVVFFAVIAVTALLVVLLLLRKRKPKTPPPPPPKPPQT